MELFMIKSGFYDIVTRKEGERRVERILEEEKRKKKLQQMDIDFERKK